MHLTDEEQRMLSGDSGAATQKAMQILVALGEIYGAERMIPVTSVQIAGVSYDNLGEAGLRFLSSMADGGGRVRLPTTLNPAGMDVENWHALGIPADFAEQQLRVLEAYTRMGITPSCTCTPYLGGNLPAYGEHLAWSESSAVCYANSVLGARTNREGGPSALAAALTGRTPEHGMHLSHNRYPSVSFHVTAKLEDTSAFGALGKVIGDQIAETRGIPYITGIPRASLENLKSFCASLATYGGAALFHMQGITPEADLFDPPSAPIPVTQDDIDAAVHSLDDAQGAQADFVTLGCPHLSLAELERVARLLQGQQVKREFWLTTARSTHQQAKQLGITRTIEAAGARIVSDTCSVVAPIRGRFTTLVTDSAKACYYASARHQFKTILLPFDEVVRAALK